MDNPLVSVCISVYNKSEFFRKTLNSIVNQTYKNIEIIIGDNASEEDIRGIVDSFNDERIRFFRNEINLLGENFINVVKMATAEYVAVFHADDVYNERIIEEQISALINNPDVAGVFTLGEVIDENDRKINNHLIRIDKMLKGKDVKFDLETYLNTYLQNSCPFLCPTLMIKKEVYLGIGYNYNLHLVDDIDFWTRTLEKHKLMVINKHLFLYRNSPNQGGSIYGSVQRDFLMPDIDYLYRYITTHEVKISALSWFFLAGKFVKDCLRLARNKTYRIIKRVKK